MFVQLVTLSYFLGQIWLILCELQTEAFTDFNGSHSEYFIVEYALEEKKDVSLVLTYFTVTTLTTIGLGDFNPKSNLERLMCVIVMVAGVALFSFNFAKIQTAIDKLKEIQYPEQDKHQKLDSFF